MAEKLVEHTTSIYHHSITNQLHWSAKCASHGHDGFRLVIPCPSFLPLSRHANTKMSGTTERLLSYVSRTRHVTKWYTWSLGITENHRLRVIENKVLRKILDRSLLGDMSGLKIFVKTILGPRSFLRTFGPKRFPRTRVGWTVLWERYWTEQVSENIWTEQFSENDTGPNRFRRTRVG